MFSKKVKYGIVCKKKPKERLSAKLLLNCQQVYGTNVMNKDLYLIRHASSNEKESDQKDIDRTLSSDGLQEATRAGHHFKREGIQPDMIITSPAVRALGTATLIAEQLKYNTDQIHINDELYEASIRTLLQVVNNLKTDWGMVFIVTHNPAISYLAEYITGSEIGSMVSGGFAHIRIANKDWTEVSEGSEDLVEYRDPATFEV